MAQCFCVIMRGVALQTTDEWIYILHGRDMETLVEAGIISSSDIGDRDIQDRAKADSFAKGFTVLQSVWAFINVISRAAYDLPLAPIELSALAYVACSLASYAFWWHKPKDMTTPIVINLQCALNDLPKELRDIRNAHPWSWINTRVTPPEENISAIPKMFEQWHNRVFHETVSREPAENLTLRDEITTDACIAFAALAYCGIHAAAWNFSFPTSAERLAWRVFSIATLVLSFATYTLGQLPVVARWLAKRSLLPSFLKGFASPNLSRQETIIAWIFMILYFVFRLGTLALMISSLRALPVRCYASLSSVASIPHI
ncbi:hypothetical protein BGZ63DRAFT_456491 [Mariannaea sp. PMI_226]|nr:hypothetical protein BGZ63DRAFT_456491 [Mariannaea sp. PMI_226]